MRTPAVLAVLAALGLGGCADSDEPSTSSTSPSGAAAVPALASRPAAEGEIIVRGDSSPMSHGPHAFNGRYLVRFEQYAPEDDSLDFTAQTPFTAALQRREGDPRGARELFENAGRSGRRELRIRGRYFIDVSFGDFPYVLRFTPRS